MSTSATSRWVVAATMGVVETMKDQLGLCRWNYALRTSYLHAKNNISSYSQNQAKMLSAPSSSALSKKLRDHDKMRKSEESLRTVMYLSCWGPN